MSKAAPTAGGFTAAIFDMDGVVTNTAGLHAAAWKEVFDGLLRRRAGEGKPYQAFDDQAEYRTLVDGKPRRAGVRAFLQARQIELTDAEQEALAARKEGVFERCLRDHGVQTFASSIELIRDLRERGVKTAVVTSSRHGRDILKAAGLDSLFDVRLDGIDLERLSLRGKPEPDMFLKAAELFGATPGQCLVFEDAAAGVQAGHSGGFGLVVGVDRGGNAAALHAAGADLVVGDLGELDAERLEADFHLRQETAAWRIEEEGFEAARESEMESLFAVGNGYLGVRGALDTPPPGTQCDLFIAGIYDAAHDDGLSSEIEMFAPERAGYPYAELVPIPFPFRLDLRLEDASLDFAGGSGRELRRTLDLRAGVLLTDAVFETAGGRRTAVRTRRCASLGDPHLLLQEARVSPQNHWAPLTLRASLVDPHQPSRYPHLERIEYLNGTDLELVRYRTRVSRFEVCLVSRSTVEASTLRRVVCIFTSRDGPDPRGAALAHAQGLDWQDFDALFAAHASAWHAFWSNADIRVPGLKAVEQALRFGSYHLRLAAADDSRVSIGARTLTGRAYQGHVFWDTEIFMLPFFLHTEPARARDLLAYRHHTLNGARRRAAELGYKGACFAWESTVTGDDVTPTKILIRSSGKEIPVFTGSQQVHISADIAYAVCRYWEATGDDEFLAGPGAEILFETARFWSSRITRGDHACHIRGVMGPDEYHYAVNDNAYTNWMARFNLQRAAWAAQRFNKHEAEAQGWADLARSLHCPAPGANGVIEQFEGFFDLKEYPLQSEGRRQTPLDRLFDWKELGKLQIVKQADVLMLPLLFPDAFSQEIVAANYDYYEPRTDHGSSLSPPVHAAVAARIGRLDDAQRYMRQSLWLDLSNAMHNSMLGVHPAAMGGTWQALVFGFLGVSFTPAGPQADAHALENSPWASGGVELTLAYRGRRYPLKVSRT